MFGYSDPTATASTPWYSGLGGGLQGQQNWWSSNVSRSVPSNLQPTQDSLIQQISDMMLGRANPAIQRMQTSATDSINRNYATMPRTITSRLAGLGFGSSGKLGTAMFNTEGSRLSDLNSLNSQFDQMSLNQQNYGSTLAEQLLNSNLGTKASGSQYGLGERAGIQLGGTPA